MVFEGVDERFRPLLPSDEERINGNLMKQEQLPTRNVDTRPGKSQRSTSSQNLNGLIDNVKGLYSPHQPKALTDTDNFIEIYSKEQQQHVRNLSEQVLNEVEGEDMNINTLGEDVNVDNDEALNDDADYLSKPDEARTATDNKTTLTESNKTNIKTLPDEQSNKDSVQVKKRVVRKVVKRVAKKGLKDFKFGEEIGDGAYSTVVLATAKDTGKKYAVKILNKDYLVRQKKVKYAGIEKSALQRLNNSQGIVKLFYTFQDESSLYFMLDYAPNGDFLSVIKKYGTLNENCTCYYGAQILSSIKWIHSKGVIHRDIKPENILLDAEMKIKLTDFGTAYLLEPKPNTNQSYNLLTRCRSFVGTAEYVSPELLSESYSDSRADIWAFGCIVYQMIAGKPPFKANNEYLTFKKVMKVQFAFTAGFPLIIRDLVKRILIKTPELRLSIKEIEVHPFFKGKNFSDGSVWTESAPEIQPYKYSIKAMQPGGFKEMRQNTKNVFALPKRLTQKVGTPVSSQSSSNASSAPSTPTREVSIDTVFKKPTDERTAAILENARREANARKAQLSKKVPTGALHAASLALHKSGSASSPDLNTRQSSNSGSGSRFRNENSRKISARVSSGSEINLRATPSPPPLSPTEIRRSTDLIKNDKITGESNHLKMNTTPTISENNVLNSFRPASSELPKGSTGSVGVIRCEEIHIAIINTDTFEKRIHKNYGATNEPFGPGNTKSTLLSQVARGGGNVTGFRNDDDKFMESDYYKFYEVDQESVVDHQKIPSGVVKPLLTNDEYTELANQNSNDDSTLHSQEETYNNSAFGGRFMKFFHNTRQNNSLKRFSCFKRLATLTKHGHFLIFVKYKSNNNESDDHYKLVYDLELTLPGTKIKEVYMPSVEESSNLVVIQTPFNSFIIVTSNKTEASSWIAALKKSINTKVGQTTRSAKSTLTPIINSNQKHHNTSTPPLSLNHQSEPSQKALPRTAPSTPTQISRPFRESLINQQNKSTKLFDSFVESRAKQSKFYTEPVPSSGKLKSGLPDTSANALLGLGLSSDNGNASTNRTSQSSSQQHLRVSSAGSSRFLNRSEAFKRH